MSVGSVQSHCEREMTEEVGGELQFPTLGGSFERRQGHDEGDRHQTRHDDAQRRSDPARGRGQLRSERLQESHRDGVSGANTDGKPLIVTTAVLPIRNGRSESASPGLSAAEVITSAKPQGRHECERGWRTGFDDSLRQVAEGNTLQDP